MRVYVDIRNIKLEDLRTLYAVVETNDGRRMTVGGDISAWAIDDADVSSNHKEEWIPVTERLPKIADVYRVTRYYHNNVMNPKYLVDACCFDGSNTWYDDNRINHERAYVDNVIAWQENPEPYKVDMKGDTE